MSHSMRRRSSAGVTSHSTTPSTSYATPNDLSNSSSIQFLSTSPLNSPLLNKEHDSLIGRNGRHSRNVSLVDDVGAWSKFRWRGITLWLVVKIVGFVAGVGIVAWLVIASFAPTMSGTGLPSSRKICDALASPGRLLVDLTSPLTTQWRPIDEDRCPPLPHYLPELWHLTHGPDRRLPKYPTDTFAAEYRVFNSDPYPRHWIKPSNNTSSASKDAEDPIEFLRKKRQNPPTILLIGDSVDRNGLVHFCQLFKRDVSISHYHDINSHPPTPPTGQITDLTKGHGPKFEGWDQRGLPHLCEIPFYAETGKGGTDGVALRVVNGFHYGMDALDEFDTPDHSDWHKPGRIEERLEQLFVPLIEQLGGLDKVDLVQIHSGMWDLALFGMQDDKTRWSLTVPLTPDQLAWWQERMRQTIRHIRWLFPRARVIYRKLHRTDDSVAGTQYITNYHQLLTHFLTHRRRVNQLRHLQEEVARSEGLPIFDFGHVLEGYQAFQEKVHPVLVPGGVLYAQNLVHQLGLALNDPRNWRNRGWFKG